MTKRAVVAKNAPPPLPVYSQAIVTGNLVFCSGQIPTDPATGELAKGGVKEHTLQCIKNLGVVLTEAGSSLEKAVKCNVYIADMSDFAAVNEAYVTQFGDVKPARTCVAVKTLPKNVDVEIECIAEL